MRDRMRATVVALVCVGASVAHAQIVQSENYQLADFGFACVGGPTVSIDDIAYASIGQLSGGSTLTTAFDCGLGFLETTDPDLPPSPIVFSATPNFGPTEGGTLVTLSGFNFDKLGSSGTLQVSVGGLAASNVVVGSNTQLTFTTPPGLIGPRAVIVSSSFGFAFVATGFVYTPAVITSPIAMLGGPLELRNYGAVNDTYRMFVSTSTTAIPAPPYGTLLIGPFPFIELISNAPYPAPDGVAAISVTVPNIAVLSGLVVHFQSVSILTSGSPPALLTNASTTLLQ